MTVPQRRLLKAGVYAPLPTFFDESDELDLSTYRRHLLREFACRILYVMF